jgi:hypothetical protein
MNNYIQFSLLSLLVQSQGYYDANSMNMGYMRTTAVKSFRQSGGFSYILHHLSSQEFPWLGAAKLRVILFNLMEVAMLTLLFYLFYLFFLSFLNMLKKYFKNS